MDHLKLFAITILVFSSLSISFAQTHNVINRVDDDGAYIILTGDRNTPVGDTEIFLNRGDESTSKSTIAYDLRPSSQISAFPTKQWEAGIQFDDNFKIFQTNWDGFFGTNPSYEDVLVIEDGTYNVGIGTNTPATRLHVSTTDGNPFRMESSSANSWMSYYNSEGYVGYSGILTDDVDMDFGTSSLNTTGKVHLATIGSPRLTIASNGDVGIGTTNPTNNKLTIADATTDGVGGSAQLDLRENGSGQAKMRLSSNSVSDSDYFEIAADVGSADEFRINFRDFGLAGETPFYEIFTIEANTTSKTIFPQVGINTVNPTRTLDVDGDARIRDMPTTASTSLNLVRVDNFGVLHEYTPSSSNLAADNEILNEIVAQLEQRIAKLEQLLLSSNSTQSIQLDALPAADYLLQNYPNPFSSITNIQYTLPEGTTRAAIIITDKTGAVLKEIAVEGNGNLEIEANTLPSGTYTYSLVADGKILTSKKMVLTP